MTDTKEFTSIDKSQWGKGEWQGEPDKKLWLDESTGYPCRIVRHGDLGHLCGYVGVPPDHPAFENNYDDVDVECHGGLTYDNFSQRVWWLGFDCAHFRDISPGRALRFSAAESGASYKTLSYVESECRKLAKQLKELEQS